MAKIYNKLVRDKISEIIEKDGEKPFVRILDDEEYKKELKKKLCEEAQELALAENNNELIEKTFGLDKEEILKIKENRKQKRGGFEKKIFLEKTE